jgi:hypothetical protein
MNVRWKFRPLLVLGQLTAQTVGVPEAMALLKEYPNLQAMMQGCVSGRSTEWPTMRAELCRLLAQPMILIDSESSPIEQAVTIFHELFHLAGITDENLVEAMAQRCAAACPEIVHHVPR